MPEQVVFADDRLLAGEGDRFGEPVVAHRLQPPAPIAVPFVSRRRLRERVVFCGRQVDGLPVVGSARRRIVEGYQPTRLDPLFVRLSVVYDRNDRRRGVLRRRPLERESNLESVVGAEPTVDDGRRQRGRLEVHDGGVVERGQFGVGRRLAVRSRRLVCGTLRLGLGLGRRLVVELEAAREEGATTGRSGEKGAAVHVGYVSGVRDKLSER